MSWLLDSKAQVLPASSERYSPDLLFSVSTMANTRFEFARETLIPILPINFGKPSVSLCQVFPSSVDFQTAEPAPPLDTVQGSLLCSHEVAYRMRGLFMSIESDEIPVLSLMYSTFFQVAPPSVDLNTPRSLFGPCTVPCPATYTRSGFEGCTAMSEIWRVFSNPMFFQVFPASVDLYTPLP